MKIVQEYIQKSDKRTRTKNQSNQSFLEFFEFCVRSAHCAVAQAQWVSITSVCCDVCVKGISATPSISLGLEHTNKHTHNGEGDLLQCSAHCLCVTLQPVADCCSMLLLMLGAAGAAVPAGAWIQNQSPDSSSSFMQTRQRQTLDSCPRSWMLENKMRSKKGEM